MTHARLAPAIAPRAHEIFEADRLALHQRTDRMFSAVMLGQWVFGIVLSVVISPYAWRGATRSLHVHVLAAVFLGGLLSLAPIMLAWRQPGARINRHVVAVSQMLWSALLIHLTGGRIETHFHVFGGLAFLAFYRDWEVLVPATVVVAADHLLRGLFWPESVYGIEVAEWWRFLEHAGWVVFEDIVLVVGCVTATQEMAQNAQRKARLELLLSESERRKEKLAAVGQLAASVAHELRNPLTAVGNAHAYLNDKFNQPAVKSAVNDPRVEKFFGLASRELENCNHIIGELLDFARERPPQPESCSLYELTTEALTLVRARAGVELKNGVPQALPNVLIDREQFRKVLINLVQNAVEAIEPDRPGVVQISAEGGERTPLRLTVHDTGPGIPAELLGQIFQPLFTTKTRGTGLGLAIVAGTVERHGGKVSVVSLAGQGTSFVVELPPSAATAAA